MVIVYRLEGDADRYGSESDIQHPMITKEKPIDGDVNTQKDEEKRKLKKKNKKRGGE